MMWTLLLIPIFLIVLGLILAAIPGLVSEFLLGMLGGEREAYALLVELPLITQTIPAGATRAQQLGPAMNNVYSLMQTISLSLFAIVLIVAGLCYVLESFRVVSEGTAAHIITSSIFTFILIFAAKPIYNLTATAINALTSPDAGLILKWDYIKDLISAAVGFAGGGILEVIVKFITSIIFLIITAVTLLLIAVLGTLRLFFVGACAAILPLLLVLRLIPLTTRFTDSVIDSLIGFMFSSIISAIFILFGYQVISVAGWGALYKTIAALATLLAAAFMPTVFARSVGSLMMSVAGLATAATSTAVGATALIGGGAAIGGLTAGIKTGMAGMGTGAAFKSGAMGALAGAVGGLKTGITHPISITPSARGIMRGTTAAIRGAKETGLGAYLSGADIFEHRFGTLTEMFIGTKAIAAPPATVTPEVAEGLRNRLLNDKNGDYVLGIFEKAFPKAINTLRDKRKYALGVRKALLELPPIPMATALAAVIAFGDLPEKQRMKAVMSVVEWYPDIKDKVRDVKGGIWNPTLEQHDQTPLWSIDIFNAGPATEKGRLMMGKMFGGAITKEKYNEKLPEKDGVKFYEENIRRKRLRELGRFIAKSTGMEGTASSAELDQIGATARHIFEDLNSSKEGRVLMANMAAQMEGGGWDEMQRSPEFTRKTHEGLKNYEIQADIANTLRLGPEITPVKVDEKLTPKIKPKAKKPKKKIKKVTKPPKPVSKPKKKGIKISSGFGADAWKGLEEYYGDKNRRKRG